MITIVPVTTDQKPLVANLIQLYLYDMTESMPFPVGADGRFEYDFLDRFTFRLPRILRLRCSLRIRLARLSGRVCRCVARCRRRIGAGPCASSA